MKKTIFVFCFFAAAFFCHAESPPELILSRGRLAEDVMINFLLENNYDLDIAFARYVIKLYIYEAEYECVNYDIAFAQMCLHTNYLSFSGTFTNPDANNFCDISSIYSFNVPHIFDTPQTGVRAHIQHLKGYATSEPLNGYLVDPRYNEISDTFGLGSSPRVGGLSNKWKDGNYAGHIRQILEKVYRRNSEYADF